MGQKVNPIGLRTGVTYNWNSRWFFSDKKSFRSALYNDLVLRKKLMSKLASGSVVNIQFERAIKKITIIIHAVKPGLIIGRGGKGLEEMRVFINKTLNIDPKKKDVRIDIKIEPVHKPYLSAYYVAQTIAQKLVRNVPHRMVVHGAMDKVMESGGKGIKVQLGGRIGGAEISRREKYFQGTVPTSTIREQIDYAEYPALTKSGYVGVKVWVCKK